MVDPDFWRRLHGMSDEGVPAYDGIRPSDIDIPPFAMGNTYAPILDVPLHIGGIVRDVYWFGKERANREGIDSWSAMPYTRNAQLEAYLQKVGWFNGPVTIVNPPCPGLYVCLTTNGLEKLALAFPSDSYKKRKEVD